MRIHVFNIFIFLFPSNSPITQTQQIEFVVIEGTNCVTKLLNASGSGCYMYIRVCKTIFLLH